MPENRALFGLASLSVTGNMVPKKRHLLRRLKNFFRKLLKLRERILENGRSLTEAAALVGCGVSTLGSYLNGKTAAGPDLSKKLAVFLKIAVDQIPKRQPPVNDDVPLVIMDAPRVADDHDWAEVYQDEELITMAVRALNDKGPPMLTRLNRAEHFLSALRVKATRYGRKS
jgi:transcriptional regulator with XRE-family HTH domain